MDNNTQRPSGNMTREAPPSHLNTDSLTLLDRIYNSLPRIVFVSAALAVIVALSAFIGLSSNIFRFNYGDVTKSVLTTVKNYDKVLDILGESVGEGSRLVTTRFKGNIRDMTVIDSFTVPVTSDGNTVDAVFSQGTVSDALAVAGIELDDNDFTSPSLNSILKDGDSVRVYRVEYKDTQYRETVPYKTNYKYSSLLYRRKGRTYTLQEGSNGSNLVTYRERYVDGEKVLALVSKIEVEKKPVDRLVLAYGDQPVSPLSGPPGVTVSNGVPTGYTRVISNVGATGYYSARGRGSSGIGLFYGSCAVNPNIIPYGTKMYIVSTDGRFTYGWAVATDTGTAVMEGIIGVDLFYETYLESYLNGKIPVNIYIYG